MNERIKLLAERAGFYFYDMHNVDGQDLGESIEADSWNAAGKFAELIVLECAVIVGSMEEPHQDIAKLVKEHFGVEE